MVTMKTTRHHAQRFLASERPLMRDIDGLFRAVRFEKTAAPPVLDVAHFAAHRDERNRGVTWQYAKAFCANWRLGVIASALDVVPTIEEIKVALPYKADLVTEQEYNVRRWTKSQALKWLSDALGKLKSSTDGVEIFDPPLTESERAMYDSIRNWRGMPLAFTSLTLTLGLADALIGIGALEPQERRAFRSKHTAVGVFALHCMHLTKIDIGQFAGEAHVMIEPDTVQSHLLAAKIYYDPGIGRVHEGFRAVATDCEIRQCCAPSLWSDSVGPFEAAADWSMPLDLDDNGILQPFPGENPSGKGPIIGRFAEPGNPGRAA